MPFSQVILAEGCTLTVKRYKNHYGNLRRYQSWQKRPKLNLGLEFFLKKFQNK